MLQIFFYFTENLQVDGVFLKFFISKIIVWTFKTFNKGHVIICLVIGDLKLEIALEVLSLGWLLSTHCLNIILEMQPL